MTTATGKAASRPDAGSSVLVDPQWLNDHLDDPRVRVVEVDVSPAAYRDWHIDGAVLWNIYADLKDAGYRRSSIVSEPPAGSFRPGSQDARIRADSAMVHDAIGQPGITLVDVRSEAEYRGERFWPSGGMEPGGRAGHVPSAVHLPIDGIYREDGSFRSAAELRRIFSAADPGGTGELITYCTIGGRAATAWFVLTQLLGRGHVRVYDGSWAEWGRMTGTPVAGRPDTP
jgi:thiosulfate/3-mercaptopyruvate sulfurtransferase